jgi:XTP/dITP diphosphohydrolase
MSPRTIYVATTNPGKLRDFAAASNAQAGNFAIEPLPYLDRIPAPPEDEPTFEGNARAKAIYYSRLAPGHDVLADESGLEVDALDGRPGIRSARYAADNNFTVTANPDEDNNLLLVQELANVSELDRKARYRCVLALARAGEILIAADGMVEGRITRQPQGNGGFGYDPLFYLPELNKTMAEIDLETKSTFSHRGRALKLLLSQL